MRLRIQGTSDFWDKICSLAPKARNVKAWAIGPGGGQQYFLSAEGAHVGGSGKNVDIFPAIVAISRFQRFKV